MSEDRVSRLSALIELPHSAQIVYLQLLQLNECFGQGGTFESADRDLIKRTHFSKQTITQAKRELKNSGFIDYHGTARGTRYSLGQAVGSLVGTLAGNVNSDSSNLNYPKKEKRREELPPPPPPASASEARLNEIERRLAALEAQIGNVASAATRALPGMDLLVSEWEKRGFARLDFVCTSRLAKLLESHDTAELIAAMDEASLANKATGRYGAVSYNFFAEVLKRRSKKEAKKDERADRVSYNAPRRVGDKPWERAECG